MIFLFMICQRTFSSPKWVTLLTRRVFGTLCCFKGTFHHQSWLRLWPTLPLSLSEVKMCLFGPQPRMTLFQLAAPMSWLRIVRILWMILFGRVLDVERAATGQNFHVECGLSWPICNLSSLSRSWWVGIGVLE